MKRSLKLSAISLALASAIGLTGCGGGGGGTSGTGTTTSNSSTTSGVISGFGSVFVDGVEFETDDSSFSLDDGEDGPEGESELAVGMVVTVTGTVNDDGVSGTATHIEFDDELEGIVNSSTVGTDGTGTMTIMGQTVNIRSTTVFESKVAGITSVGLVVPGNVVEISGFSSDNGTIYATRIEVKQAAHSPGDKIEVKGTISNLTDTTFDLGGLTADYSSASLEDIPGDTLIEGLYVEVKSLDGFNGSGELIASKVELEDDGDREHGGDDGEEAHLNGVVTAIISDSVFEIDGNTVVITDDTEFEHGNAGDIQEGVSIKVEGEYDANGDLIAGEIDLGVEDDIGMTGHLEDVNNPAGTVILFGQTIRVDATALKIDKQDEGMEPEHFFDLNDMASGDFVEIDVYVDPDTGDLVTVKLERDDDDGDADELEGPVEAAPGDGTLVIAGVTIDISGVAAAVPSPGDKVKATGSYNTGTLVFEATGLETED